MTHDPLCLAADGEPCIEHGTPSCPCDCQCALIDKVRADTVKQIWLASKARQAEERGES